MYGVYLVDDDTLILEELLNIIPWMDNGYTVLGSNTDPLAAFDEILTLHPDVVFCDLKMPGMDGNELISRLREAGSEAEYVMLSAYDAYDDVRTFYKGSGYDYILKPVNPDDVQMILEGLADKLSRKHSAGREAGKASISSTDNEGFNKLVSYVDEHYAEKITLDMLAKQYGFSRNYICELFAKYYDMSLIHYVTDIRMKKAGEMLKDKSRPIKDIALSLGYSNPAYFYRVFKTYYGVAVGEYRDGL